VDSFVMSSNAKQLIIRTYAEGLYFIFASRNEQLVLKKFIVN